MEKHLSHERGHIGRERLGDRRSENEVPRIVVQIDDEHTRRIRVLMDEPVASNLERFEVLSRSVESSADRD